MRRAEAIARRRGRAFWVAFVVFNLATLPLDVVAFHRLKVWRESHPYWTWRDGVESARAWGSGR